MAKNAGQPKLKSVDKYILDLKPYANGDHSKLYLAKKESDKTFPYIAKCISVREIEPMKNLISNEINSGQIYGSTNCVIRFIEPKRTPNNFYLIYSYFDSYTLSQLISQPQSFKTYVDKLDLALNIAKGLNRLHKAKLMHRNLNPSHILVSKDFKNILFCGVKSIYNFAPSYPYNAIGSDPYMAPEMHISEITHELYDDKVDVYSFGVILLQLFAGIPNLTELPNDIDKNEGISTGIKKLILNCLKKNPKERISSFQIITEDYYKPEEVKTVSQYIPFPIIPIKGLKIFNIKNRSSLDPYKKTGNEFGEGSFGKVFEVINTKTNIKYAMKQIKMAKLRNAPHAKELIYGEINLLNTLRKVSFVITLIDAFHCQGTLYIILEICNGGNLDKKVKELSSKKSLLATEDLKLIAWNLAKGLLEMHKMKIVHRDLKPENILLVADSKASIEDAKICDLGLGRQLKENNPEFTTICGNEAYFAPEIRQKKLGKDVHLTDKVDVFGYGLILYFMVYGNDAISLQENKVNFSQGIIDFPQASTAPSSILELMKRCLDPNPVTRISFEEVIKSTFFSNFEIKSLRGEFVFDEDIPTYDGKTNLGCIDSSRKSWVKLYKEKAIADKTFLRYIEREIIFLKRTKSVPHIVKFVDYGMYKNKIALIFNYCNGDDLYTLFCKRLGTSNPPPPSKVFSIEETKFVARSLIQFIDQMHGRDYVHRGINPSHILAEIINDRIIDIKICGCRSSKSEDQDAKFSMAIEKGQTNLDARSYFDPNAIEDGFSEESDLWSIGFVIYFMSTGQSPVYDIGILKQIRATGKIFIPEDVDPHLQKFIEFCIRKREKGSLYYKVLLEEIFSEGIQI